MSASFCLNDLCPGQQATVTRLTVNGEMRRRLLDIGLTPNTCVRCLGRSPLGDPSAFFIRGAVIALRRRDCQNIHIKKAGQNSKNNHETLEE